MNKGKLFLWVVVNCFSSISIAYGQSNNHWYAIGLQGDQTKISEVGDYIFYEQVQEEQSPYPARVDTLDIIKRMNDSIYIVFKPNRQGDYALMVHQEIRPNKIKSIGIYYPSDSPESVENTFKSQPLPIWKELTTQWIFSKAMVKELENAPGYDEVKREDILKALAIRQPLSPMITAFMKDHPETQSFRMYRFVELKAQQKLIELGYNPYKQVPYNFEKQFEGDEEVIKALTAPMSFEKN